MATILKKVPVEHYTVPFESATCQCGSGWGISENGVDFSTGHRDKLGTQCSCGGTYLLEVGNYHYKRGGYTEVECDCGEILHCSGFTTTCNCGADYNWNGSKLAPRSLWEENDYDY